MILTSRYLARGLAVLAAGVGIASADTRAAGDVLVVGPVTLIDATSVTVLGNSYRVNDTSGIQVGDKVAVRGVMQPGGSVVYATVEELGTYTAGADSVFEKGVVTGVNNVDGVITVSGSSVDYTAALALSGTETPQIGDVVAVIGIQPNSDGVILGDTTHATPTQIMVAYSGKAGAPASVTGSGAGGASVTGSGGASVTGSGAGGASVTGSGGASVTGSGAGGASVTGSGIEAASVTGSGGGG